MARRPSQGSEWPASLARTWHTDGMIFYRGYVLTVCEYPAHTPGRHQRKDQPMTWTSFHRRGDVLRDVIAAADQRGDGVLPRDVHGVSATFADDLDLLAALQLKWH